KALHPPALLQVPRHRVAAATQVDDRLDAVLMDERLQAFRRWLRAAVDLPGDHRMNVGTDKDACRFESHCERHAERTENNRLAPGEMKPATPRGRRTQKRWFRRLGEELHTPSVAAAGKGA